MSGATRAVIVALLVLGGASVWWFRKDVNASPRVSSEPMRVAIVTGGNGPYWQLVRNGAEAAAADIDAELNVLMPDDEDVAGQTKLLTSLGQQDLTGLGVSPLDAEGQTRLINRFTDKMVVVTLDSDAPLSERRTYVGASNIAAGRKAAELLQEAVPTGGPIAVLMANDTKQNNRDRKEGFEDELNGAAAGTEAVPEFEIVAFVMDHGSREQGQTKLAEVLDQHDDLVAVVGMNARHGGVMLDVLAESDRQDVKIIAFDAEQATLDGIASGQIYASVAQDPYQFGYEAVRVIQNMRNRDEASLPLPGAGGVWSVPTTIVKQDNLDQFREALDKKMKTNHAEAATKDRDAVTEG